MAELKGISSAVSLSEVLFVADAMTGQDAVTVADKFNTDLSDNRCHPDQDGG